MTDLVQKLVVALEALHAATAGQHNFAHALELTRAALSEAKAGGWISVSDRLPEKHVEVLIAFGGIAVPSTGQYTGNEHDVNGWLYPSENFGITDQGGDPIVSHWQPLPAPPAQRGEG